jgi:hypothetical protein
MNKYYGYDDLFLWDDDLWATRRSSLLKLVGKGTGCKGSRF